MRQIIAAAAAGLLTAMVAAGCGGSATATTHPSYAGLLASYGDTVGTSVGGIVAPTPARVIAAMERMDGTMGPDWLQQVCETQSDATVAGIKFFKTEADFAKGYDATAPGGAPSARAVFAGIVGTCASEGLK